MRRREFLTLLGGAAAGWPLAARAQQPAKVHRVGYIVTGAPVGYSDDAMRKAGPSGSFVQALRELGYVEGKNLVLEIRTAGPGFERMPELVAELVGLKVDVLFVPAGPAAVAAKNTTQTIPIVMMAPDPVGLGLVGSLSRPGGNVTGLSYFNEAIGGKRLELLKELVPGLARVGVLVNSLYPGLPILLERDRGGGPEVGSGGRIGALEDPIHMRCRATPGHPTVETVGHEKAVTGHEIEPGGRQQTSLDRKGCNSSPLRRDRCGSVDEQSLYSLADNGRKSFV